MESGPVDDILRQAANVADEHYARLELEAARSLIRDTFEALPWELQEDYWEIQDLYQARRLNEANLAWDAWLAKARGMKLL